MFVSVLIPTYKRHKDLEKALDSLCLQSQIPNETIIIDQSPDTSTQTICSQSKYLTLGIQYIHTNETSLAQARNTGLKHINNKSNLILFFDDDVIIDKQYIQEISTFLDKYPHALGGGGQITNLLTYRNPNHIGYKIFATPYIKEEFSPFDAQIHNSEKVQNITTTIGCNMFFRKEIFDKGHHFPQRMEKYSYGEDMFFSHTISTQYSKSLFYVPQAKIKHFQSPNGRIFKEEKIKQQLIHMFIFFKQKKLPIRKRYRRGLGLLGKYMIESTSKKLCLKTFFQTQIFIHKEQKKIINNPKSVNKYIFEEKK